jgi:hypothetical protein
MFPACPTLQEEQRPITFRVMESARAYVLWLASGRVGERPALKKTGKVRTFLSISLTVNQVDVLVSVSAVPAVLREYLVEKMAAWVVHVDVEVHQLQARQLSVAAVGAAPPGQRLDILLDWSEKLSLEPNNSQTGATYPKIGLLIAVCVWRGDAKAGSRSETVVGVCDEPTNDVPHTHAFLRKLVASFAECSLEPGMSKLERVSIWSDGGQAHFKCAEAFVFTSHLLRELREHPGAEDTAILRFYHSPSL